MKTLEVEVVRVRITLACTECKQRNYNMTEGKEKPSRENGNQESIVDSARAHTMHKETKVVTAA